MELKQLFIDELDREGPLTKRALENVPTGKDDWKPHARSMPLGRLASLVANMPSWLAMMIDRDEFDLSPPQPAAAQQQSSFSQQFTSPAELVAAMEKGVAAARKALEGTTDAHMMKPWQLKFGGKVVSEKPRHVFLRESINHLAHHRGQLTVYLRMTDSKVPAIYGPSADDQRFE